MSWRNTGILAIAVAVVGLIAYRDVVGGNPDAGWDAVFEEPQPTLPADDIVLLLDLDPARVEAVAIDYRGKRSQSRRTAYGWSGTDRPRAIDDFVVGLSELAVILTVDEQPSDADLDGYGLADAVARIELDLDGGPALTIALGERNPSATAIYARAGGSDAVVLTGAVALWDLQKAVKAISHDDAGEGE